MATPLALAVRLAVAALVFAVGLEVRPAEALHLLRRPALLLRAFVAMYVATPLVALALARAFTLPPGVEPTLMVLSVSAGAPLLTRRLARLDNRDFVAGLVVASSALAVVTVPLGAALLEPLYARDLVVEPLRLVGLLALTVFLPLLAGVAVQHARPRAAARLARGLVRALGPLLLLGLLALLVFRGRAMLAIGVGAWSALLAFAVLALAVGHVLGPREPNDRAAMAVFCATRHLGIALLLATTIAGPQTRLLVISYALVALLVTGAYVRRRVRRAARDALRPAES